MSIANLEKKTTTRKEQQKNYIYRGYRIFFFSNVVVQAGQLDGAIIY